MTGSPSSSDRVFVSVIVIVIVLVFVFVFVVVSVFVSSGNIQTGDWCVLYQLGWIDENGNENNETSAADLMSLKPEVAIR